MTNGQRLLTTGEVAKRLGLHIRKVQRMVEAGEIPIAETVGGRHLIAASVVAIILPRQTTKTQNQTETAEAAS